MPRFSRTKETTRRARELRQKMTKAEQRLWYVLRSEGMGVSFRRQHPIGRYFADFYCAPLKLVIEVDGGQHADRIDHDASRTMYLSKNGIDVIRFWNIEVNDNLDGVCREIADAIRKRRFELENPLPTSPFQGEE